MKVLVTGATGFIGSNVTRMLLEDGHDVRVLIQPGAPTKNIDHLDVERMEGDLLDPAAVGAAVKGCREIYHLAAIYAVWHPHPEVIYKVNVEGSRTVLDAAMANKKLEKVVYTSSIAAIGVKPGTELADETTKFNQWAAANEYVMSKYVSEIEALDYVRRGLPAVIVNPTFPFGINDIGPTPTGQMILNALKRRVPGYLPGGFNAVDVEDVARGHLLAAQRGRIGERYILGGENITFRDFTRLVGQVSGVWIPDVAISPRVVKGAARISEQVSALTGRPPLATVKAVEYVDQFVYMDVTRARKELGLVQTPLVEAVRKAVTWFRENKYV